MVRVQAGTRSSAQSLSETEWGWWVTNREWCDFVSFDPRIPEKNRLFVKRCHRSNDTITDMEVAVKLFLKEVETCLNILSGEK